MAPLPTQPFAPSPISSTLLDSASNLVAPLAEMATRWPDFECLVFYDRKGNEERVRMARLWERSRSLAAAFVAAGLRPGGRAVIILPTGVDLVAGYFATLLAGASAAVLARPGNRFSDLSHYTQHLTGILANAEPQLLFCSEDIAELVGTRETLRGAAALLTPSQCSELADGAADLSLVHGEAIATLQYSSGSTGRPKGVVLTHAAILDNLRKMRRALSLGERDVSVNWIPLYHDMGLFDACLLPLLSGLPSVLIPTMDFMRDPALWLRAVHRYRGSMSWAPNFAYEYCATRLSDRDLEGLDLSSWRIAIPSAEPILAKTIRAFQDRFASVGLPETAITPVYGLAENVTAVTLHAPDDGVRIETLDREALTGTRIARPTGDDTGIECVSCGRPLEEYEVGIRDPYGAALPERSIGNIWVRSPALFSEYRGDAEATAKALVDGWLDTGDRGYLADRELFFVAREKDLIVIGGDKYAPQDIEHVVNQVPGVREGCVTAFGVQSARGTEDLAVVAEVREDDPAALDALQRLIRERVQLETGLGTRHLLLVPTGGIVKTTSGKLARNATRERYLAELKAGE